MKDSHQYIISRKLNRELKINRSIFIGSISQAVSANEAEVVIEKTRRKYFDATHNCFAYRIDENQFRFYDDGEPYGTAGRPILSRLEKYNLIQTVLIVTRFFGGKKLGRGGLKRAYSQTAEETITTAGTKRVIFYDTITVICPYNFVGKLLRLTKKYYGVMTNLNDNMEATISVRVPKKLSKEFMGEISNLGAGKIRIMDFK